jgi:AcrR family transcriptional regulator
MALVRTVDRSAQGQDTAQNTGKKLSRTARVQDPEGVKRDILAVARREFSHKGFAGARVDQIAAATRTSKRMIYYYFGDKERLYIAVLEDVYRGIRELENTLELDGHGPTQALTALVAFTFDYQNANPDFVRLIMNENIHDAVHLKRSRAMQKMNAGAIDSLARIIARGQKTNVFRKPLDPVDLHMTISALSFFNVANRATFSAIFKTDMGSPASLAVRRAQVIEIVLRYARP